MPPFHYTEAQSLDDAVSLLSQPGAVVMGGGTDLLPQVRDGVVAAERLVGLAAIPGMAAIAETIGLTIGAAATIADVAAHPAVRRRYAALAEAAGGLATPQIRNEGTIGGNLGQRPRCWCYRSPLIPCLKKGGDRCYALAGNTRLLCVTGGDRCYIVHPSDTAVAFSALDARVETAGPNGGRVLTMGQFFAGPGGDLLRENVLEPGELVARIVLPADAPERSVYLKVRERESGDFALVSIAAALSLDGNGPDAVHPPGPHRSRRRRPGAIPRRRGGGLPDRTGPPATLTPPKPPPWPCPTPHRCPKTPTKSRCPATSSRRALTSTAGRMAKYHDEYIAEQKPPVRSVAESPWTWRDVGGTAWRRSAGMGYANYCQSL